MKRDVRLTPPAAWDLVRLTDFLAEKNPGAATRAANLLKKSLRSLEVLAERGRPIPGGRELVVRFGRYAYIISYRVDENTVVVARIHHSHEDRQTP